MRTNERMKKALSILLCLCMVLQYAPMTAFAVTTDNLCEHHPVHTAECHHVHNESCGYAQAVEAHECLACANSNVLANHSADQDAAPLVEGSDTASVTTYPALARGIEMNRYYFVLPADWVEDGAEPSAYIYWWDGTNACYSIPGYKAEALSGSSSIFYYDVPQDVTDIIWNNGNIVENVLSGSTVDINAEYYDPGESDLYPDGTIDFDGMIYVIDPGNISENPFTGGRFAAGEWYYFDPETCISRNYGSGNVDLNTLSWACTHVNAEKTYTDNKDGKQHIAKWSCCGTEVTEAHTGGTATCTTKAVCEACGASYGELDPNNHEYEKYNGICCDTYQSATLNADGYYEISNAGQLFWFAQQINKVDRTLSAVLTADIDLENRPWTPIGSTGENSHNFRGVFDGQNHTIRGLYVEGGRAGLGFFGEVRTGTVKNFTIYGEVVANTEVNYVGGVIGSACGLNGDNDLERNGAVIQNITSYVNLTAKTHGIGMVGGFVGYANHETLIENCSWYGTFDAGIYRVDSGAGGFIGRIYDSASVTIRNCGAYGTVKTAYQSGTFDNQATIYIGGFLSYSPSGAKTVMENNLWAGKIINNTNLTAANAHLSAYGTLSSNVSTTNCYALEGTPYVTTGNDNADGITTVTAEQLKSGEVAYKLGAAWGQTIGTDDYPILGGAKVYYGYTSCAEDAVIGYTNDPDASAEKPGHAYDTVTGQCANCDDVMLVEYELWVGGTQVTSFNAQDVFSDGTVSYDAANNTLTLDAYTYTGEGHEKAAIYYGVYDTLNLVLVNDSTVTHTGSGTVTSYGVRAADGSITVSGTGSLTAKGSATSGSATSYGVYTKYNITVSGGSLTGIGGDAADGASYGVRAVYGALTVSGGSLTGIGGETANAISYGVLAVRGTTVTGGSLTSIGGYSWDRSCGLGTTGLTMAEGIGLQTPVGGWLNEDKNEVYDASGKCAAQVRIGAVYTVSVEAENGTVSGAEFYAEGASVTLTVTPSEGYLFESLTVDGADVTAAVQNGTYTFTMPAKNVAVTAVFAACDHSGNENTKHTDCTVDFVCSVCNAVFIEAKENHDYVNHFCSVCGMEEPVYLAFLSLSLKGNIGVNYYMHIDETIAADETGYMAFTTPRGGTVQIPIGQANVKTVSGQPYYVFTATVAAKEMTDIINGQYIWQGGSTGSYGYSVKQYADIILANESGSASFTKAQPMVQAMLNYGAYAQVDFGYNTDNLAADLSQADVSGVTAQTLSGFANANKQGTALAPLYAATLVLKTETTLRLFFQVDASVTNLTVTRGETSLTVSDKSGLKYCALENISAKDLDADYTITVNDGTESANVTYNPMSYCYNVLNAAEGTYSDSLLNAVRALYLYNLAANAYFG